MAGVRATSLAAGLLALSVMVSGGLVACTPDRVTDCPQDYTAGVVWSSQTSRPSWLHFTDDTGQPTGSLSIDVRGMATMLDGSPLHVDDEFILLSTGNAVYDETHVVAVDVADCAAKTTRIQEPSVLEVVDVDDGYVTTNWLNGTAELHRYRLDGDRLASASFPHGNLRALTSRDGLIYAFRTEETSGNLTSLLVLNDQDLTVRAELPLPPFNTNTQVPGTAEILGDELFFTVYTEPDAAPDNRLWVINLTTLTFTTMDLGLDLPPYLLHGVGDTLYVAHGDSVEATRQLSVVDTASGEISHHQLATPIDRMDANATTLAVIHGGAGDSVSLSTYHLPAMTLKGSVSLPPPRAGSDDYYYAANVFVP